MSLAASKLEEKLKALLRLPTNKCCFVCTKPGLYNNVDVTVGVVVCTACGGLLRSVSHTIKSTMGSSFNANEVATLERIGNANATQQWLAYFNSRELDRSTADSKSLEKFIRTVFVDKRYQSEELSDTPEKKAPQSKQTSGSRAESVNVCVSCLSSDS